MVDSKTLGSSQVACNSAAVARRYHAMVKPIGPICNLDCTYCYYLHKKDLLGSGLKTFWAHIDPYMKNIIARVKQEHSTASPVMPEKGLLPGPSSGSRR